MSKTTIKRLRLECQKCSVTLQETGAAILRTQHGYWTADSLRETSALLRDGDSPIRSAPDRATLKRLVAQVREIEALVRG